MELNVQNWSSPTSFYAMSLLAIVAACIVLPVVLLDVPPSDSGPFNLAWVEGVAAEMRKGWIYPRWLSMGFNGLGSPSFYFYPPLPFLIMGGAKALAGGWLTANAIVQLYAFLLLSASGISMWVWARGFMDRSLAMLSGMVYMAMPYHLFDYMYRGALGEFSVYAVVPLLLVAVRVISRGGDFGVPLFAVLYAVLILFHLPAALLVSVFVHSGLRGVAQWSRRRLPFRNMRTLLRRVSSASALPRPISFPRSICRSTSTRRNGGMI